MSDTTKAADDVMKLLDRDDIVVMYSSGMGSYMAVSVRRDSPAHPHLMNEIWRALGAVEETLADEGGPEFDENMPGVVDTDDFMPSQALYRLTEKATTGRIA
jgi:hypothetical protein